MKGIFRAALAAVLGVACALMLLPVAAAAQQEQPKGQGQAQQQPRGQAQEQGQAQEHQHSAAERAAAVEHMADRARLHGGQVVMTKMHNFEVLFSPDGVHIFGYRQNKSPIMLEKASGKVTLHFKDGTTQEIPLVRRLPGEGERTVYFCPMHPEIVQADPGICTKCGGMKLSVQDELYAAADLSKAEIGSLRGTVEIEGFSEKEPHATFPANFIGFGAPATKLRAKATDPDPPPGEPAHP